MTKAVLSKKQFKLLFENFNSEVRGHGYEKLDYQDWQKLKKMTEHCVENIQAFWTVVYESMETMESCGRRICFFDTKSNEYLVLTFPKEYGNTFYAYFVSFIENATDIVRSRIEPPALPLIVRKNFSMLANKEPEAVISQIDELKAGIKNLIGETKETTRLMDLLQKYATTCEVELNPNTEPTITATFEGNPYITTSSTNPAYFSYNCTADTQPTWAYNNSTSTTPYQYEYTTPNWWEKEKNSNWVFTIDYNKNIKEGNKKMNTNNLFKNFDFGPVPSDGKVKLSMYGMAVKNVNGTWVSYDAESGQLIDVDILSFDAAQYLYKYPVALNQIVVGDVIIHNHVPIFVTALVGDKIKGIDPVDGEERVILPVRSPFGFNFATKVINILNNFTRAAKADANNPFGNMLLPLLLNGGDADSMLPILAMSGALNCNTSTTNLLPLLLLSNKKNSSDPLMLYLALSGSLNFTPQNDINTTFVPPTTSK